MAPDSHLQKQRRSASTRSATVAAAALAVLVATAAGAQSQAVHEAASPTTLLISRSVTGGTPNGPSSHGVMSNDKRYVRAIAFQSGASNIVRGDTNGQQDVFVVLRTGSIPNTGTPWKPGRNVLISRTASGAPANGPSSSPSIDGSFHSTPSCVGFLSSATNIVKGDTNGQQDAFVAKIRGGKPRRVSLPNGRQSNQATTAVVVSGNCRAIAFVTGGKLYVSTGGKRPRKLAAKGTAADPAFSTGIRNDLVFGARGGAYLSKNGTGRPKLVGRGGRNPVYNDIKRQTVAYEKTIGGTTQIAYHDLGKRERIISADGGRRGNGNSRNPVIGNSGFYVTFETDASNLQTSAAGSHRDSNGDPDVYLYTDTRKITLAQSVEEQGLPRPGGGSNPSMSFYSNYITFDGPGASGNPQVMMRYVGGL
jgi:hypothetical protein